MSEFGPAWRVRRVSGLLWPGFTKRFAAEHGMTYLWGVPIGRFVLATPGDGSTELRYVRWPVVDVVAGSPPQARGRGPLDAAGFIRLPLGRRVRFCRFRLER